MTLIERTLMGLAVQRDTLMHRGLALEARGLKARARAQWSSALAVQTRINRLSEAHQRHLNRVASDA